jgi:Protein of unknown function (DUF3800)
VAIADEVPAFAVAATAGGRVRIAFLDDSAQPRPTRDGLGGLVALGAIVVDEAALDPWAEEFRGLCRRLGLPPGTEVKWSPPRGNWLRDHGAEVQQQMRERMLHLAIEYEIRTVVVLADQDQVDWSEQETQKRMLRYLYERVSMLLEGGGERGVMIADEPGGGAREQRRWLAQTLRLTSYGTEYVDPLRIVLPILTTHSDHVPHLQLADLVVAATTAAVAGNAYALELVPLLGSLAHTNARGTVGGTGVKLIPDELRNLHHWVFGERLFWKVATGEYWPLPIPDLPYATDDGLAVTTSEGSGRG